MGQGPDGAPARVIERIEPEGGAAVIVWLDCGHRRHVRHRPPLESHPWVADPAAHAGRIGTSIECGRCFALELPVGATFTRRTKDFDEQTLPSGLRTTHHTKPRTWGRIVVTRGRVGYAIFGRRHVLDAAHPGIVPPEVPHRLVLDGPVTLHVEFLRCEAESGHSSDGGDGP